MAAPPAVYVRCEPATILRRGMSISAVGPAVGATDVKFRLRLPADGVRGVRLCQHIGRPWVGTDLEPKHDASTDGQTTWWARIPRPAVDRLEYQYELEFADGTRELTLDPHNPLRAPGPFGEKSVVEMPGYRPPGWLDMTGSVPGRFVKLDVVSDLLGTTVDVWLWASPELDVEQKAPLIIAHDGPEYDRYSSLLHFVSAMIADGRLRPLRVVLLPPVDRNEHYAASPLYSRALARELVPVLDWLAPQPPVRRDGRPWRVGVGASLGALALLHAHRSHPDLFGALFLQSGSFFQWRTDRQESGFFRFDRISRFVGRVLSAPTWPTAIPVGMTCGTVEENLVNNWLMRDALALQGYQVDFSEHRDAHNWIAWRDSFDPHLVDLLKRALE